MCMKLKSNIGRLIEEKGLRNDYICKHVDVKTKQLWNWKVGESYPTIPKAFKLAKLLGVRVDDLYEIVEDKE
jgi:DNA-binding XRE family transcriptional regulator